MLLPLYHTTFEDTRHTDSWFRAIFGNTNGTMGGGDVGRRVWPQMTSFNNLRLPQANEMKFCA